MQILKFRTNIANQDYTEELTQSLNQVTGLSKWEVDSESEDNILSVSGEKLNPQDIEDAIQKAGFKAELLRVLGITGEGL